MTGTDRPVRDSSPDYIDRPEFNTEQIVDWDCPVCGEPGFDNPRTADYYPTCSNSDCPVRMFSVFRGERNRCVDTEADPDGQ